MSENFKPVAKSDELFNPKWIDISDTCVGFVSFKLNSLTELVICFHAVSLDEFMLNEVKTYLKDVYNVELLKEIDRKNVKEDYNLFVKFSYRFCQGN